MLESYPDLLLEGIPDRRPRPGARYEATEAISLAFVTALQLLPPRQRAALILCDVLGYRTGEAADMLTTSYASVASALTDPRSSPALTPPRAWDSLLALPTDDIGLSMAPHPSTITAAPPPPMASASCSRKAPLPPDHAMTLFGASVLPRFGLPRTLPT